MKLKVKLMVLNKNNEQFMGNGPLWLLERIKRFGSINQAAKNMRMSYVKAHKILTRLEKNLKRKILIKSIGGSERGGAILTPFTERLISEYNNFQSNASTAVKREFFKFVKAVNKK